MANGLQSNVSEIYCDCCDPSLTHDSASVRKAHSSGKKHKEGERLLSEMGARAGSEPDGQNNGCISAREDTSYSIVCSSSCGAMIPPPPSSCPGMIPAPNMGGPPMMPVMGPPLPGMLPMGPAPGKKPPTGGHMPMMPAPPVMRPPTRPMRVPSRPGLDETCKKGQEPLYNHFI